MDEEHTNEQPEQITDEEFNDLKDAVGLPASEDVDPEGESAKPEGGKSEAKPEGTAAPAAQAPATPQEDKPVLIAGKFKSHEDLIQAYQNLESEYGKSQSAKRRVEELLARVVERAPVQPDKPATPTEKTRSVAQLIAKAALEEPDVDDDTIINALLPSIRKRLMEDEEINTNIAQAMVAAVEQQRYRTETVGAFFEANPELSDIRHDFLYAIANEEQQKILAEIDPDNTTPQEFTKKVLEATADRARAIFGRTRSGTPAKIPPPAKKQPSGTRSEGRSMARPSPKEEPSPEQKEMMELLS